MERKLDIEYSKEMIQPPESENCEYAPVYLNGEEIGEVTLTDEWIDGKITGRTLYLFYPHSDPERGYEASTCEKAVKSFLESSSASIN